MTGNLSADPVTERLAIHGQSTTCRDSCRIRSLYKQTPGAAQFFLKTTDGIVHAGATQAVGTHQLSQSFALMCRRELCRFHLQQAHVNAEFSGLPCGFTACQASTDNSELPCCIRLGCV